MKIAAALLLFCLCSAHCAAQTKPAPTMERPATDTDDSMVLIHGGTLQMGINASDIRRFQKIFNIQNAKLFDDELPRHTVTVKDFYLDKYLVTNSQFKTFLEAKPGHSSKRILDVFDNGNFLQHWKTPNAESAKPDHPVVNVYYLAALRYCRWVNKRLPTEAEWEFAARGGRDSLFPWGDEPPDQTRANFNNNIGTTTPVGTFPPNPYGLYDMAGNVWQYLSDRWQPYVSDADQGRNKGSASSDAELQVISSFPNPAPRYVIRGGSFAGHPVNLWVEYRDSHPANGSQPFVGFRCAKSSPN